MTNDFEMVSAARPARNEEGTGAVMEAMKSFYRNIELKDLSKAAQAEIKLLATKEGKSLTLAPIFDSCGAISNYLNWNINLLTRPAMAGVQSMEDAFSLDLFSEKIVKVLPKGKVKIMPMRYKDANEYLENGKQKEFVQDFYNAKRIENKL
jgi:hypothetical protein